MGTPLAYFQKIQKDVKAQGVTTMQVLDATAPKTDIGNILATFSNTVTPLGACLYEAPPGVGPNANVYFTIPVPTMFNAQAPAQLPVPYNANCNATNQTSQNGWNLEGSPAASSTFASAARSATTCACRCSPSRRPRCRAPAATAARAGA